MHKKLIIAVDPGAKGAIAVFYPLYGPTITVNNFESEADAAMLIRDAAHRAETEGLSAIAYVEKVGGFIQGKEAPGSAMFKFGRAAGIVIGAILAQRIPLREVRPQDWQKGIIVQKLKGPDRKRALRDAAQKLYPNLKCTLANSDALLILDYARKQEAKI